MDATETLLAHYSGCYSRLRIAADGLYSLRGTIVIGEEVRNRDEQCSIADPASIP